MIEGAPEEGSFSAKWRTHTLTFSALMSSCMGCRCASSAPDALNGVS